MCCCLVSHLIPSCPIVLYYKYLTFRSLLVRQKSRCLHLVERSKAFRPPSSTRGCQARTSCKYRWPIGVLCVAASFHTDFLAALLFCTINTSLLGLCQQAKSHIVKSFLLNLFTTSSYLSHQISIVILSSLYFVL